MLLIQAGAWFLKRSKLETHTHTLLRFWSEPCSATLSFRYSFKNKSRHSCHKINKTGCWLSVCDVANCKKKRNKIYALILLPLSSYARRILGWPLIRNQIVIEILRQTLKIHFFFKTVRNVLQYCSVIERSMQRIVRASCCSCQSTGFPFYSLHTQSSAGKKNSWN